MRILCAPDKYKGSLSAPDAAAAMARGILRARPGVEADLCPIADGGEGTVEALVNATGGENVRTNVSSPAPPYSKSVNAPWGLLRDQQWSGIVTAVIEMAAASGLALLAATQRDPSRTSTFGTGELIRAALNRGARKIILGIGGSATNDGGCGAAQALGICFFNNAGRLMSDGLAGGNLGNISRIEVSNLDQRVRDAEIVAACDVNNPLTGPNGAAAIYGPQKGATPEQVVQLDQGLAHLANLWREQLGIEVETMPGAGAAGGLGGGLVAFLGAKLRPGAQLVLDAVGFRRRVAGCDLCLTGEGRLDGQSLSGKACLAVASAARALGVPTIALVGSVGDEADRALGAGLESYEVIGAGLPLEESMRRAGELIEAAAYRVIRERFSSR